MKTRNKDSDQYVKFSLVIEIIKRHSDESHGLCTKQIQQLFYEATDEDYNLDHRRIKDYVENYNKAFKKEIIKCKKEGRELKYYFMMPNLSFNETKAIIDLIYSSDFFTNQTKENYKIRMEELLGENYLGLFEKKVYKPFRGITGNEYGTEIASYDSVFKDELKKIAEAIVNRHKISFVYRKPDISGKFSEKANKDCAPIDMVFNDNKYYLLIQSKTDDYSYITYRMDYVHEVKVDPESKYTITDTEYKSYNDIFRSSTDMYVNHSPERSNWIRIEFVDKNYPNVIDKIGYKKKQGNLYKFHHVAKEKALLRWKEELADSIYSVDIEGIDIGATFYSWVIGFNGNIKIVGPERELDAFHAFLDQF